MQYVMLIAGEEEPALSDEERSAAYEKIGAWWGELAAKGKIVGGNELQGPETAKTVRVAGEKVAVTDGPFIESKEVIGGYGVLECESIDEAVAIAKTWPSPAFTIEVRPTVYHGEA